MGRPTRDRLHRDQTGDREDGTGPGRGLNEALACSEPQGKWRRMDTRGPPAVSSLSGVCHCDVIAQFLLTIRPNPCHTDHLLCFTSCVSSTSVARFKADPVVMGPQAS
jgi:hypothetical protein